MQGFYPYTASNSDDEDDDLNTQIGGILPMRNCAYVFNFNANFEDGQTHYQVQRFTIGV